jgi:hypothetical protein
VGEATLLSLEPGAAFFVSLPERKKILTSFSGNITLQLCSPWLINSASVMTRMVAE